MGGSQSSALPGAAVLPRRRSVPRASVGPGSGALEKLEHGLDPHQPFGAPGEPQPPASAHHPFARALFGLAAAPGRAARHAAVAGLPAVGIQRGAGRGVGVRERAGPEVRAGCFGCGGSPEAGQHGEAKSGGGGRARRTKAHGPYIAVKNELAYVMYKMDNEALFKRPNSVLR